MIRRLRYYLAVIPAVIGVLLVRIAILFAEPIDRHIFREVLR